MSDVIDVSYVAKLARLNIEEDQIASLQSDMEEILEYINQLSELNVDGIEPMAHAVPLTNVVREDVKRNSGVQAQIIANAPSTVDDDMIRVPQVLPGQEESC